MGSGGRRVSEELSSWKGRYLSFGGRITLVISSLSSLPVYYMSLFRMQSTVIKKLDRIRRNSCGMGIVRRAKMRLIKWSWVIKPKVVGGLGL